MKNMSVDLIADVLKRVSWTNKLSVKIILALISLFDVAYRVGLRLILGKKRRDRLFKKFGIGNLGNYFFLKLSDRPYSIELPWGLYTTTKFGLVDEREAIPFLNFLGEGDVVIDVGASHGWYTLIFAKIVGETGKVISIEPHPGTLNYLKRNVFNNKLKNVEIIEGALSDKNAKTKLYISTHRGTDSILNDIKKTGYILVEGYTLDKILASFDEVKFLKMDIEGAEKQVLEVCNSLRKVKTYLVEVHSNENMFFLVPFFKKHGYKITILKGKMCDRIVCSRS